MSWKRGDEVLWTTGPEGLWTISDFGGVHGVEISQGEVWANVALDAICAPATDPYRIVFRQIMGCAGPWWWRGNPKLLGERIHELQDWIGSEMPDVIGWATALSIIEAVESIVQGALDNGNIKIDEHGNFQHLFG